MSTWSIDYHQALQFRFAGLVILFGILWPGACLLVRAAARLSRNRSLARRLEPGSSARHGYET